MRTIIGFWVILGVNFFHCKQPERISIHENSSIPHISEFTTHADSIEFSKEYLLGKFNPDTHPDFVKINSIHTTKTDVYLRKDAYEAFVKMHDAAQKDGIKLKIISSTRNFSSQKTIWEAKWNGERLVEGKNLAIEIKDSIERARIILRYSSMPGTSRHHWGTDIDINDLNDSYFLSGNGKKEYEWLTAHAHQFGYYQPYTPKGANRPNGYEEEKWHWTYLPISKILVKQYNEKISLADISGFKGAGTASTIDVIKNYVLGINRTCLP
ncbi:MAG: M15 family metallopeptidase [Flavobacteriales bacterium]|nr:M15 family metallopeptidase [Flavobacteriales bacterium]